jgi:hypothetical protein
MRYRGKRVEQRERGEKKSCDKVSRRFVWLRKENGQVTLSKTEMRFAESIEVRMTKYKSIKVTVTEGGVRRIRTTMNKKKV